MQLSASALQPGEIECMRQVDFRSRPWLLVARRRRPHVADVVERLIAALQPDDTVIGGGNVGKLKALPPHSRHGDNANAFRGGFRLWAKDNAAPPKPPSGRVRVVRKT